MACGGCDLWCGGLGSVLVGGCWGVLSRIERGDRASICVVWSQVGGLFGMTETVFFGWLWLWGGGYPFPMRVCRGWWILRNLVFCTAYDGGIVGLVC